MNEIQRLIHEMCPDGVPMVALGDLFDQKNGYTPSKNEPSYWENGNLPWFRMEDIRENGRILNDSILHITPAGLKKSGLFPANSIIVATSATIGEHALITVDFLCNQRFTCLVPKAQYKDRVNMKFYFYIMFEVDEWCKNHVNQGGFASVDMSGFSSIQIPLPPLPIQQRIVEILDKFTSLVSSLDSEIALRQKQYEYYRNKLLSFEEGVPMVALGDIASVYDGTHQTPKYSSKGIKFVSVENIDDIYTSDKYITKEDFAKNYKNKPQVGDILMTRIGSVGRCAIVDREEPIAFYVSLSLIRPCDKIINKYLKYIIESRHGEKELRKRTLLTTVPLKINLNDVGKILIPIPPLPLQQHIVRTLDTFESLLTNLKKERELRQKQYEYYREKLLTFA